MTQQIAAAQQLPSGNPLKAYWYHINLVQQQLSGVYAGYQDARHGILLLEQLDCFVTFLLQLIIIDTSIFFILSFFVVSCLVCWLEDVHVLPLVVIALIMKIGMQVANQDNISASLSSLFSQAMVT
jgi:hypothetical protein